MKVGIIGAGSIAGTMADTIKEMDCAQNYAVAARDYGRAAEFAQKYGFEKAYGSYKELVEDAGVELVYTSRLHVQPYHTSPPELWNSTGKEPKRPMSC